VNERCPAVEPYQRLDRQLFKIPKTRKKVRASKKFVKKIDWGVCPIAFLIGKTAAAW